MPDGPELFRVQPDALPTPPVDVAVPSWPIGSFAPMAFYRPAPIVDFTRTALVQFLLDFVLHAWLATAPGIFAIGAYAVVALIIGRRAYVRWLCIASTMWKVATIAALALNLLFVSFITLARGCGSTEIVIGLERAWIDRTPQSEGCAPSRADLLAGYGEFP